MNHALLVGVLDRVADLAHQFQALAGAQLVLVGPGGQPFTLDQLHGKEGLRAGAGIERARLEDLGDAGVLKAAQHLDFVLEAQPHLIGGETGVHDLQGHGAGRLFLPGFVDGAHAALADLVDDAVAGDLCWRRGWLGEVNHGDGPVGRSRADWNPGELLAQSGQ